jgi:4-carboxymuconolactone decarboxylase
MPRLPAITGKADVPAEHHPVVDAVIKVFGTVRGPFSMFLHSPKLAERLLPLVTFFRDDSRVDPKLRLIAILTAVREREAAYPWSAQVNQARKNGLREEVIDLIRAKGDPRGLSEDERNVVEYVRDLMRSNRPNSNLLDALKSRHGADWVVELTTAAHYFAMIGGIANAFDLAPPPDGDRLDR